LHLAKTQSLSHLFWSNILMVSFTICSWCVDTVLLFAMYVLMSVVIQPSWLPNPIKLIIIIICSGVIMPACDVCNADECSLFLCRWQHTTMSCRVRVDLALRGFYLTVQLIHLLNQGLHRQRISRSLMTIHVWFVCLLRISQQLITNNNCVISKSQQYLYTCSYTLLFFKGLTSVRLIVARMSADDQ